MKLKIYDTGYYTKDNLSNRESFANMAGTTGSVNAYIILNVKSITRNAGSNVDDTPNVGNYTTTDLNYTSFANATYDIECFVDKIDPNLLGYDYNELYQIMRLEKTKGIKVLYVDSTSNDRKTIVELLGAKNAVDGAFLGTVLPAGTPYISGRVLKVSGLKDDAKTSKFTFKITFECIEEVQD